VISATPAPAMANSPEGPGVARNTLFLVAGQLATAAVSFAVTAILARHLGARDYGVFYLAATLVQSAFVFVDLGQQYYVVARIAKKPSEAAGLLGTGLAIRLLGAIATYPLLAVLAALLDYPESTRQAISLTVIFFLLCSIGDGVSIILRGLERMDREAALRVASKTLVGVAIGLAVIGNGRLTAVLLAQILGAAAAVTVYWFSARRFGMMWLWPSPSTAASILSGGAVFLLWSVVVNAQSSIDALLLSVLAPTKVIGWHGAAWKVVGMLTFPANVLAAALYPTLARLYGSAKYGELLEDVLRATVLFGFLAATGTVLFADTAIALIYGGDVFGPAAGNLRVLAAYVPLVFVDITLGAAIMAARAMRPWILAKLGSVLVAAGVSVVLIPLSQSSLGNGGLGCAAGTVAAELVMFIAALFLVPVDRARLAVKLSKEIGRGATAAVAMAVAAWMMRDAAPLASMAIALTTYFANVFLLGAIRREDIRLLRDIVRGAR
jgi:O-antigen/teichoic acid export membrane protein